MLCPNRGAQPDTAAAQPAARSWDMWALARAKGDSPAFYGIGSHRRYAEMHGGAPVPVIVTEDPDGDMLGWIEAGNDTPVMIQHRRIFEIQFPGGSKAKVERNHGVVVPLRVEAAPPTTDPPKDLS